jgi:hypothetical protein
MKVPRIRLLLTRLKLSCAWIAACPTAVPIQSPCTLPNDACPLNQCVDGASCVDNLCSTTLPSPPKTKLAVSKFEHNTRVESCSHLAILTMHTCQSQLMVDGTPLLQSFEEFLRLRHAVPFA